MLMFEEHVKVVLRHVCPKDVKKMLVQRTRSVYWKRWAAKRENEELKEMVYGWRRLWLCYEEK